MAINKVFPAENKDDAIFWCGNQGEYFSVKDLCTWAEGRVSQDADFIVSEHARKVVPPKVSLLFWQVCFDKIASKLNLIKRGIIEPEEGKCVICRVHDESVIHLFLHCSKISGLWYHIMERDGIAWSMPNSMSVVAKEWPMLASKSDHKVWELTPFAMFGLCGLLEMQRFSGGKR